LSSYTTSDIPGIAVPVFSVLSAFPRKVI